MIHSSYRRLKGALLSGNPAARLGILLYALSPACRVIDPVLPALPSDTARGAVPPCLWIVSPPRSGSTILYQVLIRVIPSVYIANLHLLFPRHASRRMLRQNRFGHELPGFRNYYGYTSSLYDINEGNDLVSALFAGDPSPQELRARFLRFAARMGAAPGRPLIFKNVRNYPNVVRLHRAVPEVKFLRMRRDLVQSVQSVLHAYYELGHFHPIPRSLQGRPIEDPLEYAVAQILGINAEIDENMAQVAPEARRDCSYEDFCLHTWEIIESLMKQHLDMDPASMRKDSLKEPLKVSKRVKVTPEEAERIDTLLERARAGSDA